MTALTDVQTRALAQIQQRLAACTQAGDARKADAYAACYTLSGVLQLEHETIAGREAIRAWMAAPSVIPPPGGAEGNGGGGCGVRGFISHHLTSCHVEFTGDASASARTYWMVTSAAGLDHNGYYVDELAMEDGEWLIARRRPRTLWISPVSVLHGRR